ncbi:MAG: hypothetical protein AMXMBFR75_00980 [Candidatus Hinthialibacteria bacterium]
MAPRITEKTPTSMILASLKIFIISSVGQIHSRSLEGETHAAKSCVCTWWN